jgi:hypothetical protein
MNAYFIRLQHEITEMVCDAQENRHYETFQPCEVVYAETRGRARAIFAHHFKLDFVSMVHIRLVDQSLEHTEGIARPGDPLWDKLFWSDGV